MQDDFFMDGKNDKPFFKAGLEGFAGAGKSFTSALLAIGIHRRIHSTKPTILFDTEKAGKFYAKMLAKAGIGIRIKQSRSLADLMETMHRLRDGAGDVLIIDSISHVWENFLEAYKQKVKRNRLEFQDWGILKPKWKDEFSDPFVQDPYHIIMSGRAGYEYESEINEETKKREIYKSGIKMKVEGDTAYEPDILVLMERMQEMDGGRIKRVYRQATVLKDRADLIDGKVFENPTYDDFEPAIEYALENPEYVRRIKEGNTALLFKTDEEKAEFFKERDRWLEEIQSLLTMVAPNTAGKDKQYKAQAIYDGFGTGSWEAIKRLKSEEIKAGYLRIRDRVVTDGRAVLKDDRLALTGGSDATGKEDAGQPEPATA